MYEETDKPEEHWSAPRQSAGADDATVAGLLQAHGERVRAALTRLFGSQRSEDIHDAVTDALMKIRDSRVQFDDAKGDPAAYLLTAAKHNMLMLLRKEQPNPLLGWAKATGLDGIPADPAGSGRSEHARQVMERLHRCIDGLSPMQRDIILTDLEERGESQDQALADRWETKKDSIWSGRTKAKARLKELWEKEAQ